MRERERERERCFTGMVLGYVDKHNSFSSHPLISLNNVRGGILSFKKK